MVSDYKDIMEKSTIAKVKNGHTLTPEQDEGKKKNMCNTTASGCRILI